MKLGKTRRLINAGLAGLLLSCGGEPTAPNSPQQQKPPTEQTQPLTITSSPSQVCLENTFYSYQPTVTGGTGVNRQFSITDPSFLKIDNNTGLITGICPEVPRDSALGPEITVTEGTNKATQKWLLMNRNTSNSYRISPKDANPLVAVSDSMLSFAKPVAYSIGDILGADTSQLTPKGVLRKIAKISSDGTRVTTTQPALEEVIKNGSFSIKGALSQSSMQSFRGISGVTLSPQSANGIGINLDNVALWDGVILNGHFDLNTDFYFEGNVKFLKLDYLDVGNKSSLISDVTLGINISGLAERKEVLIGQPIYLTPITVPSPVGGIPIVIVSQLGLYAGINPTQINPLSVRIRHESSLEMGVKYDGNWNLYFNLANKFDFSNPVVTGDWDLDVYIKPKITWLMGLLGLLQE